MFKLSFSFWRAFEALNQPTKIQPIKNEERLKRDSGWSESKEKILGTVKCKVEEVP